MEKIFYIGDLNKDKLLKELWNNSNLILLDVPFDLNVAKKNMKNNYPDYVCGRLIKVDIYNEDNVNYSLYDRNNYDGAFLEVISKIKKNNTTLYDKIEKDNNFIEKASYLTDDKKGIAEALTIYNDLFYNK